MISEDKTKILVAMPKVLKQKLETEAKEQNRSTSNLIVTILTDFFKKKEKQLASPEQLQEVVNDLPEVDWEKE